ncbi:DUF2235 domain-containing protein [Terriglobus roseus]|uniref:Uncharacterized alpha/beta hydrolase domain n=1 Tax=Terriglobus roseus TaxID=392734 RepID=A0A1G7P0B6_9BACT|nr:DUF2235 domain-containing protein [Terriglobus roseus]SDF79557.1 Uncharacterized alpha/beta hydrolase domain [Terriglobus roseus]
MKKIILCADGTWNSPPGVTDDGGGTNVWKIYCAMPDTDTQLKFYDSGVGTKGNPVDHLTGGAMGQGLFEKVQDCYSFLSHVYDPGDSIYLFGFSRGAYTARSVGGMIAAFGVPTKNLSNATTAEIFAAYRESDKDKRAALKTQLKQSYDLQDVHIAMIGVWDTVGALGIPGGMFHFLNDKEYGFLDTTLSDCVDRAFHAVSIDERRAAFQPTLWTAKDGSYLENDGRVEQVWFAGVHCDVGGSYADSHLADITLGWMMHKAKECGVEFLPDAEAKYMQDLQPTSAEGAAHDEWSLLKWGIAKHRTVPDQAHLASSVFDRCAAAALTPGYQPENLTWDPQQKTKPHPYPRTEVLPYSQPVWPAKS